MLFLSLPNFKNDLFTGKIMLLHHMVIERAKKLKDKPAIIDKALDKTVSYSRLLIASLLLAKRFKKYKGNFLGVMLPNTAGCS